MYFLTLAQQAILQYNTHLDISYKVGGYPHDRVQIRWKLGC